MRTSPPTTTSQTSQTAGYEAEANSALMLGLLHFFAAVLAIALLWNSAVIERQNLLLWAAGETIVSCISFTAAIFVRQGKLDLFIRFSQAEGYGTAMTFGSFAWLGANIASESPSQLVLLIAFIGVTAISATNSSHITRRRFFFTRLIMIVGASYTIAYLVASEWVLAVFVVFWSAAMWTLTQVGYRGMLELVELRTESELTARHDDLTGLLSRSAFFDTVGTMTADDAAKDAALVLFDLDGFKAINDSFGHPAGDAVLQVVAKRLELFLPENAALGRLGGDEFAAIFPSADLALDETIQATLQAVSEPIRVDDRELYVAASAGWTPVSPGSQSAELLAEADAAMYQSKNSETATSTGFDTSLRQELDRSLDIRQRFRTALKRTEIEFWAQPLVRSSDCAPVAIELLARWPQADESMIGPLEFTRVADETGLAVELDRQALRTARVLLDRWQGDQMLSTVMVKANISPVHLHNNTLIDSIRQLIPEAQRRRLGLEFVESRLIQAAERNHDQLQDLLDMGITLSIDDFGVGYSSLTYLRSLPVSEIKIDRSFVTNLDNDEINQGLVRAIVDIASTLGLPTVAEGIETEGEFTASARLGVTTAQGYYIGHPLPLDQTETALRALSEAATSLR